jgi:glyoxylase-like metal-dependent hydrolase (beta-lactamase superfamily II)
MNYIIYSCLILFISLYACEQESNIQIDVTRISDRVIVFSCLDVNVTAIASGEGIIIIDTNRSPGIMEKIKSEVENIFSRDDFIYVINTHGHGDHCSGNQVFEKTKIVGHDNCRKYVSSSNNYIHINIWSLQDRISKMEKEFSVLEKDDGDFKEMRATILGWNLVLQDLKNEYIPAPPNLIFDDSLTLNLGDLTIKMIYCGEAHTNNDIFIYIPEEKIVFTGDMFITESQFGFAINKMVDVKKIISSMERIIKDVNGLEYVIPGHGNLFPGDSFNKLKQSLIEKQNKIRKEESVCKILEDFLEKFEPTLALRNFSKLKAQNQSDRYYWLEDEFNILGRRYMAIGMVDKAICVFTLEVESFPTSALAYDNLGEAYLKNGEIKNSIENYEKSLAIYPDNKNAQKMLNFLRDKNN